jgi:uncharacterized protein YndB with AHSA1/START domain
LGAEKSTERKPNKRDTCKNRDDIQSERDDMRRVIVGLMTAVMAMGFAGGVRAEVKSAAKGSFRIEQELILPATPNEVFDAVTGDISGWWDHSFSGHPKKLYIEARPGGGVYEIFDDAGNGALHATVIYADRGKKLRYTGPLGFSGRSLDMVTTYDFSAVETGTKFHLTVTATGDVDEALAAAVDGVWHHFLDERLKAYITSGDYKTHGKAASGAAAKEMNPAMKDAAPNSAHATIADFAWLGGRWIGTAGSDTVEEICTAPARGSMTCVFRSMDATKIDGLELTTLRETGGGIEERVRFFEPDLKEQQGDDGITLRVTRVSDSEIIFDNAKVGGVVKHVMFARHGKDGFGTRIEVVDAAGKSGFIVAEWKRAE